MTIQYTDGAPGGDCPAWRTLLELISEIDNLDK
jgi:hypothetical protein